MGEASLKQKLSDDLKQAMRSGDTLKRGAIRMLMAAINNAEIARQVKLEDSDILGVIAKEAKQHRESIEAFKQGNIAVALTTMTILFAVIFIICMSLVKAMQKEKKA